jgi:hypothetical protein
MPIAIALLAVVMLRPAVNPNAIFTETRHAVPERTITHGCVTVAASVVLQHMVSDGPVFAAFGVKKERTQ